MIVANDLLAGFEHYGESRNQRQVFWRFRVRFRGRYYERIQPSCPSRAGSSLVFIRKRISHLGGKHRRGEGKGGVAGIVRLVNTVALRIMPIKRLARVFDSVLRIRSFSFVRKSVPGLTCFADFFSSERAQGCGPVSSYSPTSSGSREPFRKLRSTSICSPGEIAPGGSSSEAGRRCISWLRQGCLRGGLQRKAQGSVELITLFPQPHQRLPLLTLLTRSGERDKLRIPARSKNRRALVRSHYALPVAEAF